MRYSILKLTVFCFICTLTSCYYQWVEVEKAPKTRTVAEDLEIVKKYMRIDEENQQFSVVIDDEIMAIENLSESNLIIILNDIAAMNQSIAESIRDGEVTTLYLTTADKFETKTFNLKEKIPFTDTRSVEVEKDHTGRAVLNYITFNNGSWVSGSGNFSGPPSITSKFNVLYASGFWKVNITCNNGNSYYGKTFTAYGSGVTNGTINRYWWFTDGGMAPYNWSFNLGTRLGGDASGSIHFISN